MSDLGFYLEGAESGVASLLLAQWTDAVERREIRCPCGLLRALEMSFRCLYCGVFFCVGCAEAHFGETVRERRECKSLRKGPPDGRRCPVCGGDTYDCRGCGKY